MRAPLALTLLAVLLGGCIDGACGSLLRPLDVPRDAPAEGGSGPRELTIRLRGGPGVPVGGAGVVVFWADVEPGEPLPSHVRVETVRLRADPDAPGLALATAHVPDDRVLYVVAYHVHTTTEWLLEIPAGGTDAARDLWLYPRELEVPFSGSIEDPATQGATGASWWPHEVLDVEAFGPDAAKRLRSLEVSLRWENTPTAGADLGIGVGDERLRRYQNPAYQTGLGAQEESWTFEREDLEAFDLTTAGLVSVGPSVSTGQFSLQPLDYEGTAVLRSEETETVPLLCEAVEGRSAVVDGQTALLPPPESRGGSAPDRVDGAALRIVVTLVGLLLAAVVAVLLVQSQGKKDG